MSAIEGVTESRSETKFHRSWKGGTPMELDAYKYIIDHAQELHVESIVNKLL